VTVCRPQIARALEDGLVDAARCDAIADRVPRRAAIPERTGDRVGRATAHRQDDGVHAVEAALGCGPQKSWQRYPCGIRLCSTNPL
jgi:hypothetical protein